MRSTGLLYKFLPTNLGVCKPTFYTFYTSHLTWNSTIYHTDLGQNAVFHFFFKANCTQSIFRTINRGLLAKPFKKFPKSPIRPACSHFYSASYQCGPVFEWSLIELRFNIITNLSLSFFVIKRFLMRERLLTINNRNIIRWNIYRDDNFHSRRSVSKKSFNIFKRKAYVYVLAALPGAVFTVFKDELLEARKSLKVFFLQPNW